MAGTHDIPYGTRHYGIGFSAHTGAQQVVSTTARTTFSASRTISNTVVGSGKVTSASEKIESYDANFKKSTYESSSFTSTGSYSSKSQTFTSSENFSKADASSKSFGKEGIGTTNATGSTLILYEKTFKSSSFSFTRSAAGENFTGTSSGSHSRGSTSSRTAPGSVDITHSTVGYTKSGGTNRVTTYDDEGNSGTELVFNSNQTFDTAPADIFGGTVQPVTGRQRTSIGTETLEFEIFSISTKTTRATQTYTLLSSNLLDSDTSEYTFRTTTFGQDFAESPELELEDFIEETITYENFTDATHREFTVSGGGFYVTGGDILPNRCLANPQTATTMIQSNYFSSSFNSTIASNYQGNAFTYEITEPGGGLGTTTITSSILSSSEDTRASISRVNNGSTLDFGRSENSANEFTTETFIVQFQSSGSTTRRSRTSTRTQEFRDQSTFQGSNFTFKEVTINAPYYGDQSFGTYSFTKNIQSFIDTDTILYYLETAAAIEGFAEAVSKGTAVEPHISEIHTGGGRSVNDVRYTIATFDKGLQGGIQNDTSTNISGNVREPKEITIADQLITTATSSSTHITVNSFESQSYSNSAGFPLDLELKLNRYMSFFPSGNYGSIYTDLSSMEYHLIPDGLGESLIGFTSTGKYSTSANNIGGSFTLAKTTKSFSTNLRGIVECQLGQEFPNGQKIRIVRSVANQFGFNDPRFEAGAHGGYIFTDIEGALVFSGQTPTMTLHAYDSAGSTVVSLNSTDIDNEHSFGSITLPPNAIIYAQTFPPIVADEAFSADTFDRAQNR